MSVLYTCRSNYLVVNIGIKIYKINLENDETTSSSNTLDSL